MMKRFMVILFAVLYVGSVSGITVNYHYCGGKLASVNLNFFNGEHRCACGSKKMKKSCCKNENITVKVQSEHKTAGKPAVSNDVFKNVAYIQPLLNINLTKGVPGIYISQHDPPPKPNNSLLVMNNIFRI